MHHLKAALVLGWLAGAASCRDGPTVPHDGRLPIYIAGLPEGVSAAVTVEGPDGFSVLVPDSRVLTGLRPGDYALVVGEVTTPDARYVAAPATRSIAVPAAARAPLVEVAYVRSTAALAVDVAGLPPGTASAIVVTGPGGFTRPVTASTTLTRLEPGSYTVAASDVPAGASTYRADPAAQTVVLGASATAAAARVSYGAGTATLDLTVGGLPSGVAAAITVTGPDGLARTVTATSTLRFLAAGSYSVSPALVGADLVTYAPPAAQVITLASGGAASASVEYAGVPLQLQAQLVAEGLNAPVFLTAPDGDARQFVVERLGRIRILDGDSVRVTPFLDIATRVNFTGERGMLGMAFDPAYATNGRFFVYYVALDGSMVVERFSSTPGADVAGPSDGIVIAFPHGGSEHHGGTLAFGPDRMLYLGPGDGRCCGDPDANAQNLNSLLGKILRIDVRTLPYAIPLNNPLVGREQGGAQEIWAWGLRNPWRFSFDGPTGQLFIGDVGQDAREEIDIVAANLAGVNYGWPFMEGTACYTSCSQGASTTLPAHEYTHRDGCSVTGGYVYRGSAIPELTGSYLYADYCRGWVRSFRATNLSDHRLWTGISVQNPNSFGRDGRGELYLIGAGKVWRVVRG